MQSLYKIIVAVLAFAVLVPPGSAQSTKEPEKLKKMREIYTLEVSRRKMPILKDLAAKLLALRKNSPLKISSPRP